MDDQERLKLMLELLKRSDERRGSITQRSSFVLSAAAILVAGVSLFLDKPLQCIAKLDRPIATSTFVVGIAVSLLLLLACIACSLTAIANIGRTSKEMLGTKNPSRLIFYPRQTIERFKKFDHFSRFMHDAQPSEITANAIGHLWVMILEQFARYQRLRRAARLLLAAGVPFIGIVTLYLCMAHLDAPP